MTFIKSYKMTEEHKRKIGLANSIALIGNKINLGKKRSEETKKRMSENHFSKKRFFVPSMKNKHHSEETKQKLRDYFKGKHLKEEHRKKISQYWQNNREKHNFWKGGITSINNLIRHSEENKQWIKKVFQRDNYICQECKIKNGNGKTIKLNAHHIKHFSLILQEFLNIYSQFSPIEDKETLVRLAITYQSFWDTNNGITLCENCHNETKFFKKRYIKQKKENSNV